MYCKNCGKEIEENSTFCKYCGTNLHEIKEPTKSIKNTSTKTIKDPLVEKYLKAEQTKRYNETDEGKKEVELKKSESKSKTGCIIVSIISIILIVIISLVVAFSIKSETSSNDDSKPFSRSATNSDLRIDSSDDFSLDIKSLITPNCDISALIIEFTFYDSKSVSIKTITKSIGNVSKNTQLTVTISLSEFTFTEVLKLRQVSASVVGGTVSVFN